MVRILALLILVFSFPAFAQFKETDDSYYSRLEKTCEHTERETWRDYLLYAPNKRLDKCCRESIAAMRAAGAREENGPCPEGARKARMDCPTAKHWCEPLAEKN